MARRRNKEIEYDDDWDIYSLGNAIADDENMSDEDYLQTQGITREELENRSDELSDEPPEEIRQLPTTEPPTSLTQEPVEPVNPQLNKFETAMTPLPNGARPERTIAPHKPDLKRERVSEILGKLGIFTGKTMGDIGGLISGEKYDKSGFAPLDKRMANIDQFQISSPMSREAQNQYIDSAKPSMEEEKGIRNMSYDQLNKLYPWLKHGSGTSKALKKPRKLAVEEMKAVTNQTMALKALDDMDNMLKAGYNPSAQKIASKFDTKWGFAMKRFVEGFARPQTGAAITTQELENFTAFLPGVTGGFASPNWAKEKIAIMKAELMSRFFYQGFSQREVEHNIRRSYDAIKSLDVSVPANFMYKDSEGNDIELKPIMSDDDYEAKRKDRFGERKK